MKRIGLLVATIYLVVGVFTLSDYGINWDEPYHFNRGQAYLHFLLTGETDYSSLPPYPRLTPECATWVKPKNCGLSPEGVSDTGRLEGVSIVYEDAIKKLYKPGMPWRSYYQSDGFTFSDIIDTDEGHPPANGILAALFNKIFFQKLHIFGDIESHQFFEVFTSFLIVLGVYVFTLTNFGPLASLVATLSIALYPLFFAESHFNIKDPPLTAFFGLTIIFFYFGIVKNRWRLILISAVFAGLALGTKFNAFFLPVIIFPWFLIYLAPKRKKTSFTKILKPTFLKAMLLLYPIITLSVFIMLWPYLWTDPIGRFQEIMSFYKDIGTNPPGNLNPFIFKGYNLFPSAWIALTTPVPILVLSLLGIAVSLKNIFKGNNKVYLLVMLWLLVPIGRVTLPGASIYGGVRQIMEFIPPLAILAGIGATYLNRNRYLHGIIILSMFFVAYEMYAIHPNQNVYFNQIIGGLSGAKEKNIPYWGNSYGNTYLQGISWINENAEPDARLGLPISTLGNIPRLKLRSDISLHNSVWSGRDREGEYEIELDFDWPPKSWYSYAYYDVYLEPVFVADLDGVPLLKVWKNDLEHTKKGFESETSSAVSAMKIEAGQMFLELEEPVYLTEVKIEHASQECNPSTGAGHISISLDGITWQREPEPISIPQVPKTIKILDKDTFIFLFAAKQAKHVAINPGGVENPCLFKNPQISAKGLEMKP